MELTKSLEEYIITIYELEEEGNKIRVTDIAGKMIVTKPSVNRALKTLKEKNIIQYEPYTDIKLTQKGIDVAKKLIKKYDVVRIFLTEILGVDKEVAENDAPKIKANISEQTEQKLEQFMSKELKLDQLKCNHSWENKKCRNCKRTLLYIKK